MIHTILVIDDHERWRDTLRLHLEGFGYEVHTAADWFIANKLAGLNQYDLIISDNQLGEDRHHWGVNILPQLKRRQKNAKTILISTEEVEEHPADIFVRKDLIIDDLLRAIEKLNAV